MTSRAATALLCLALLGPSGCNDDRICQRTADQQRQVVQLTERVKQIRDNLSGQEEVRRLLRWYAVTGQEPEQMRYLLPYMLAGITRSELFQLRQLENHPLTPDRRRRQLRLLRNHITLLKLWGAVPAAMDRYTAIRSDGPVSVPGHATPLRLMDTSHLLAATGEAAARRQIQHARQAMLGQLAGALERSHREARRQAKRMGVNLFALVEEREDRNTREELALAEEQNRAHEKLFAQLWRELTPAVAKGDTPLDLATLRFLLAGGLDQTCLERNTLRPLLEHMLGGLGIPLALEERRPFLLQLGGADVALVPVRPPDDVRLLMHGYGGLQGQVALAEHAGQAVCWSRVHQPSWEMRTLWPNAAARTLGYLLGLLWSQPAWWEHLHRPGEGRQPLVHCEMRTLQRRRLLAMAVRLRLQAAVLPVIRAVLEGASPRVVEPVWKAASDAPGNLRRTYARLMTAQLGLHLAPGEELSWAEEIAPLEPGAFDLRSYALAHQLLQRLRREHGLRWFTKPDVGRKLVDTMCTAGAADTPATLATRIGFNEVDLTAPWAALAPLMDWDAGLDAPQPAPPPLKPATSVKPTDGK